MREGTLDEWALSLRREPRAVTTTASRGKVDDRRVGRDAVLTSEWSALCRRVAGGKMRATTNVPQDDAARLVAQANLEINAAFDVVVE